MAKYIQVSNLPNPLLQENDEEPEEEIENQYFPVTSWVYNHRLGYVDIFFRNNGYNNRYWIAHNETSDDLLPIHPLLGLEGLRKLFLGNLNNPNKAELEGWKDLAKLAVNGQANISLLKGIKLQKQDQSYIIYSKRDHTILAAPGLNAETITTDRFNFVEVSLVFISIFLYVKYTQISIFC